ncbi:MAG: M28 family metallopeptidase [Marinobacter sp.]
MIFSLFSIFDTKLRGAVDTSVAPEGWWVQFGDDILVYAADAKWEAVSEKLKNIGAATGEETGKVIKGKMHLVRQKGRLFQQEHPDVRIILDKGRYLVVEMDKADARKLTSRKQPCFHIEPLKENSVVFETRHTAAIPQARDAGIDAVLGEVNQAAFEANLAQLVSYPTRLSTSPGYKEAAKWASAQLSVMGYSTTLEPVTLGASGESANVIATRSGSGSEPRHRILVVAHLDSINHTDGPLANAPGADDNGSGSAGLLAMASALAAFRFDHDLTFVLFGGEEQGLHGSTQYVASLSTAEKGRIRAVVNMDMIGSVNTASPTVMLEGATLSQPLIDDLTAAAAIYTSLDVQVSLNPFASDHVPFIDANIPAVLTIEGADSANDAIHTANDTLDRVDPAFATETVKMNTAVVARMAVLASDVQPGCDCNDSTVAGLYPAAAENRFDLSSHYQKLFAQYARLHREGQLQPEDYSAWQHSRVLHVLMTVMVP